VDALADSLSRLERRFGPVQFETMDLPCSEEKRYVEEMGANLMRRFFSFEQLVPRDSLPALKKTCTKIESMYADHVEGHFFRTVNVDPGILTPDNLVMATHHEYNHRIYLSDGVFAEMQLVHSRGQFVRLPWTGADYCHEEAIEFFLRVRESFSLHQEIPGAATGQLPGMAQD
jgi:hypothetical protein